MDGLWKKITSEILALRPSNNGQHLLIGIDGVDGAGKTTFAGQLVEALNLKIDSNCIQLVSIDGFHNVREVRYKRGKDSPLGFFKDSFDYESLKQLVLNPIRKSNGDSVSIVPRCHDLNTDLQVTSENVRLEPSSVVIVEGIFLHRDEIRDYFDFTIFLEVPFAESVRRLSSRDGSIPDPSHPSLNRYVEGQRIYFERCSPRSRASLVIDNSDLKLARIVTI
ncbi:MAG: AAA family ATPase [Actinomycetota bacterium]